MSIHLYALGSNSSGQLGIGNQEDTDTPRACKFPTELGISSTLTSKIRKVVAGGNHTLCLCEDGSVYGAGDQGCIQGNSSVGVGEGEGTEISSYFTRVTWMEGNDIVDTFMDVSASWSASLYMTVPHIQNGQSIRPGKIFACGKGDKGELGLGKGVIETLHPRLVAIFGGDSSLEVSHKGNHVPFIPYHLSGLWSSMANTVTCSSAGAHVYGWGACRKGQLGASVIDEKIIWQPREMAESDIFKGEEIDSISQICMGRDFVLLNGIFLTLTGLLKKHWRRLGSKFSSKDQDAIQRLLAEDKIPGPVVQFSSWSNIYFLNKSAGTVSAIGRDDHGQLPPQTLPKLTTMNAGSEHCVGLTRQGQAVAWGWGEHGNCGSLTDETGHGWRTLNIPKEGPRKIVGVGAGCATTFIWTITV